MRVLRAPEEIRFVPGRLERDPGVHLRLRQTGAAADREEALLELAARQRAPGGMLVEDRSQDRVAAMPVRARQDVLELPRVQDLPDLGLVERALDRAARQHGREVEQRPRDRRASDPVHLLDVAWQQRRARVRIDPLAAAPALARGDDVDRPAGAAAQLELGRRGAMRQRGALPAREHGRHVPAVTRQRRVPHRVHAGVHAVQPPGSHAVSHRAGREPSGHELP